MVSLKTVTYLAYFKTIKNESRVEIIFLAVFFICLFIPMLHISNDKISKKENRNLAEFKPLINSQRKFNYDFGKDFDAWYSDRFFGRKAILSSFAKLRFKISSKYYNQNGYIINKQSNWGFTPGEAKKITFTNKNIDDIASNFEKLKNYCLENNIKLYVLVVPTKSAIYTDKMQDYYNAAKHLEFEKNTIEKINKKLSYKLIYPYKELIESSNKDYTYFKAEHHWSDFGAFTAYKILINEMTNITPVTIADFDISQNNKIRGDFFRRYNSGTTYISLGLPDKLTRNLLNTKYNYYTYKNAADIKESINGDKKIKTTKYNKAKNNYRVLISGTSMNENLQPFLAATFSETLYLRLNNVKNVKGDDTYKFYKRYNGKITDYKPDIMIFCITFNNLRGIRDLMSLD